MRGPQPYDRGDSCAEGGFAISGPVLLVGGGKFVGRRLLARLIADGYRVDVLNRGLSFPPARLPAGAVHRLADRSDTAAVRRAIGGCSYDAVFDTSGYRPQEVRSVLDAVDARRYVYVSTLMVYSALSPVPGEPGIPDVGPLAETDETVEPLDDPAGDLVAGYAGYKRACELTLLDQDRVPGVVLRPCGIYGTGDYVYRHDYFFDRVVRDRPVLVPDSHSDRRVHLSSVDGLIELAVRAARAPAAGHLVLNAVDSDALTCRELAELCASMGGATSDVVVYPAATFDALAAGAPPRARFPFGPEPGFTLSGSRAARELGWPGTSVDEGTAALFADFQKRHRAGRNDPPDFSVDDAVLAALGSHRGRDGSDAAK